MCKIKICASNSIFSASHSSSRYAFYVLAEIFLQVPYTLVITFQHCVFFNCYAGIYMKVYNHGKQIQNWIAATKYATTCCIPLCLYDYKCFLYIRPIEVCILLTCLHGKHFIVITTYCVYKVISNSHYRIQIITCLS